MYFTGADIRLLDDLVEYRTSNQPERFCLVSNSNRHISCVVFECCRYSIPLKSSRTKTLTVLCASSLSSKAYSMLRLLSAWLDPSLHSFIHSFIHISYYHHCNSTTSLLGGSQLKCCCHFADSTVACRPVDNTSQRSTVVRVWTISVSKKAPGAKGGQGGVRGDCQGHPDSSHYPRIKSKRGEEEKNTDDKDPFLSWKC